MVTAPCHRWCFLTYSIVFVLYASVSFVVLLYELLTCDHACDTLDYCPVVYFTQVDCCLCLKLQECNECALSLKQRTDEQTYRITSFVNLFSPKRKKHTWAFNCRRNCPLNTWFLRFSKTREPALIAKRAEQGKQNSCLKLQQRPLVGKLHFFLPCRKHANVLNVIGHIPGHETRGCHVLKSYPVKFPHRSVGAEVTSLLKMWGSLFRSRGSTTATTRRFN